MDKTLWITAKRGTLGKVSKKICWALTKKIREKLNTYEFEFF